MLARSAAGEPRVTIVPASDAVRFDGLAALVDARLRDVDVTVTVMLTELPDHAGVRVDVGGRVDNVLLPEGMAPDAGVPLIADAIVALVAPLARVDSTPAYRSSIDASKPAAWSLGISVAGIRENGERGWEWRGAVRVAYRGRSLGAWVAPYAHVPQQDIRELGARAGLVVERSIGDVTLNVGPHIAVGRIVTPSSPHVVTALGGDFGVAWSIGEQLRWVVAFEPELALRQVERLGRARFGVSTGIGVVF